MPACYGNASFLLSIIYQTITHNKYKGINNYACAKKSCYCSLKVQVFFNVTELLRFRVSWSFTGRWKNRSVQSLITETVLYCAVLQYFRSASMVVYVFYSIVCAQCMPLVSEMCTQISSSNYDKINYKTLCCCICKYFLMN